jgi:hypothetical protein
MACRDHDYEKWLQQAVGHFNDLFQRLCLLCETMEAKGLPFPAPVAKWWRKRKLRRPKSLPTTQENIDLFARLTCQLCQAADDHGFELPPTVAPWWLEHRRRDEEAKNG